MLKHLPDHIADPGKMIIHQGLSAFQQGQTCLHLIGYHVVGIRVD